MSTKIQADEISSIIKERIDNFELNKDYLSKYRDNYAFYGIDLVDLFEPTDFYSKNVLKKIKKPP
jgi:hypothetical protein